MMDSFESEDREKRKLQEVSESKSTRSSDEAILFLQRE